jgi:hypothetical protein
MCVVEFDDILCFIDIRVVDRLKICVQVIDDIGSSEGYGSAPSAGEGKTEYDHQGDKEHQ